MLKKFGQRLGRGDLNPFDVGGDAWRNFVCVETANTKQCAITVQPGQTHTVRQVIRVAPR